MLPPDDDIRLAILNTTPICEWSYPRILVGIPLERSISYADKVFFQFMSIAQQGPAFVPEHYGRIDLVRNMFVKELLLSRYTHLLMLDIDHVHPRDIIQRLARWVILDPGIKVVSGLNFRRGKPFDPVCGDYNGSKHRQTMTSWEEGLVRKDETGAASLLVHRSVFEEMEPPWFFNIYDEVWENSYPGEDIGFSRKCAELNISMYVDTTTSSPHCIESTVTEETYRRYVQTHPWEFENEVSPSV